LDVSADFLLGRVEIPHPYEPAGADDLYEAIVKLGHEDQLLALGLVRRLAQ
jgi:hypothetical protein